MEQGTTASPMLVIDSRAPPRVSRSKVFCASIQLKSHQLVIAHAESLQVIHTVSLQNYGPGFLRHGLSLVWETNANEKVESERLAICTSSEVATFLVSWDACVPVGTLRLDDSLKNRDSNNSALAAQWLSFSSGSSMLSVFEACQPVIVSIYNNRELEHTIPSPSHSMWAVKTRPDVYAYSSKMSADLTVISLVKSSGFQSQQLSIKSFDPVQIKYSKSGIWVAAVKNPLMGYHIDVYSLETGSLFYTYSPEEQPLIFGSEMGRLCRPSNKSRTGPWLLEWGMCPTRHTDYMLSADSTGLVYVLFLETISRVQAVLCHRPIRELASNCRVWVNDSESYKEKPAYFEFPPNTTFNISQMILTDDGHFLATVTNSPCIVWIWDMNDASQPLLIAVICNAESQIESVKWQSLDGDSHILTILFKNSTCISAWSSFSRQMSVVNTKLNGFPIGYEWVKKDHSGYTLLAWSKDQLITGVFRLGDDQPASEGSQKLVSAEVSDQYLTSMFTDILTDDHVPASLTREQCMTIGQEAVSSP